jgi:hypothetical protein
LYTSPPAPPKSDPGDYTGWVRLYVVEPTARWKDNNGYDYHFGFLDFALDSTIVLPDGSRYHRSVTWDASAAGWYGVSESNIMVIATIFNAQEYETGYSYPPYSYPFTAYYVDATAGATPGTVDSNNTTPNSTHTVFVDEATATWCPNCPTTNYYLNSVYLSGNYNFFYATLVVDKNSTAYNWSVNHYNLYGVPTCYADGGDYVIVGGASPQGPYQTMINSCAQRPVSDIGLLVGVEWSDPDIIQIDVALAHGTPVNTIPNIPGTPAGETIPITQTDYDYSTSCTDAESDQVYYRWAWGDGDTSAWLGPYNSGETCVATHQWADPGTYEVRVQSRDPWYQSDWSAPLVVNPTCCVGIRGNVNGDAGDDVNVADLTSLVDYLFRGGPTPDCQKEANVNGDAGEQINVADLTYLVDFLFRGGPQPPSCS